MSKGNRYPSTADFGDVTTGDVEATPVLIVDDSPTKLRAFAGLLDDSGMKLRVDQAASGTEALACVLENDYALILLDVNMPDMSGFETAEMIRARRLSRNIPLIFVTADTASDAKLYDGYSLGAVDFITSPIVPELLLAKVRVFVSAWRTYRELERVNSALNDELHAKEAQTRALERSNRELQASRNEIESMTRRVVASEMEADAGRELALLIETANAPIIGVDLMGRIAEWNGAAARILGVARDKAIGRDFVADYVPEYARERVKGVIECALEGKPTDSYELDVISPDGRVIELLFNCTARHDLAGRVIGAIGVGQDLSELRQTQNELLLAGKLASFVEMSAGVVHELTQPLGMIGLAATNARRKLQEGCLSDASYLESKLERIEKGVQRAAEIIDQMRISGRSVTDQGRRLSVNDSIAAVGDLMQEQLRLAQVDLHLQMGAELPMVIGNAIQLEQVLVNLLRNASDAYRTISGTPTKRAQIVMESEREGSSVVIRVRDRAGGVPEALKERIFDPFFTTKGVGDGAGLGLSVSCAIIKGMQGELVADNVDGGATFTIRLPAAADGADVPLGGEYAA